MNSGIKYARSPLETWHRLSPKAQQALIRATTDDLTRQDFHVNILLTLWKRKLVDDINDGYKMRINARGWEVYNAAVEQLKGGAS